MSDGPPGELVRGLVEGPSVVTAVEWHPAIGSTNERAAALAGEGAPEGVLVLADEQTAGRGRRGRPWSAPAGSSLLSSVLLRPAVEAHLLGALPLVVGLAVAEAVAPHAPGAEVTLKWPNDVLADGRKLAGVLVQRTADACVVGVGLNVDWRDVTRPPELAGRATSLAELAGGAVDRWRVLAGYVGVLGNRYDAWLVQPWSALAAYRGSCATLGQQVRVSPAGGDAPYVASATGVAEDGALEILRDGRSQRLHAGEVTHLRPVTPSP